MKITFLGTRGYIDSRTSAHRMHTACRVSYAGKDVMIDCGEDWRGQLGALRPHAIVLTHAHPDHAFGLADGAPCPVWATAATWEAIDEFPLEKRQVVRERDPVRIRGIDFEAFPVEHSTRAPAVGYRITAGKVAIFYVPDLVYIRDRATALRGCSVYIGDGATIENSMVRKPGQALIGHTPVRTQLTWCRKEGVPRMIVTHCGSCIVDEHEERVLDTLRTYAEERDVEVQVAHDGDTVILR